MNSDKFSEEEAFATMFVFLEQYYSRTKSEEIGVLLGSLAPLGDCKPLDIGMWSEWEKCASVVKSRRLEN